jgi:hypothetical protein
MRLLAARIEGVREFSELTPEVEDKFKKIGEEVQQRRRNDFLNRWNANGFRDALKTELIRQHRERKSAAYAKAGKRIDFKPIPYI